jgi:beta-lactamase superfamily II metal-dependent hydrolase
MAMKKAPIRKTTAKKTTSPRKTAAPKKITAKPKPAAVLSKPSGNGNAAGLRVRMYRVGFGDFFLLTVPGDDGPQHVLIDCGVTPGTTHKGDIGTIKDAVADMAKETGNRLALIIMTHRHMDHIIGFSRCGDVFQNIKVDAVWMPYWESEYDADGSQSKASKFQEGLTALALQMQQHLALAFKAGESHDVDDALGMLRNATGIDHEAMAAAGTGAASKKGTGGGSNKQSLTMLKTGLGVTPEYYARGDKPKIPPALAATGLTAEILGPPPAEAADSFMKLTDLQKGVGQYLGAGDGIGNGKKFAPFGRDWWATSGDYKSSAFREWEPRPNDATNVPAIQRLESAVNNAQPDLLLTAVKNLDRFLNNQSLVVLFTFQGKKLLFVGDAQAGNWEYWMYGGTPNKAPSVDTMTAEGKAILGSLDFYKVGHHGSTNATPVTAVEAMGGNFASLCSTQEDSYGDPTKGTEVPREPLLEALEKKSALVRSDQIKVTVGDGVDPAPDAPKAIPEPTRGKFEVGSIYIDYLF